jgi:hypothetical protein
MGLWKYPQSHIYCCWFRRLWIGLSASLEDVKANVFVGNEFIYNHLCLHSFVCNMFRDLLVFSRFYCVCLCVSGDTCFNGIV